MSLKTLWSRLTRVAEAEASHGIDKIEDPVKMTKQVLVELKEKLGKAFEAQASVKAIEIRLRASAKKLSDDKGSWITKAGLLQDKIDKGGQPASKLEPLIVEALNKAENAGNESARINKSADAQQATVDKLEGKIKELRGYISETEAEIVTLGVRSEVADVTKEVNKELSSIGVPDSTKELLDRMKAKVEKTESEAQAYDELSTPEMTTEDEIEKVLSENSPTEDDDLLARFRKDRKTAE